MQLILSNGYAHAADEVALIGVSRRSEYNAGGQKSCITVSWTIGGFIQAANQSELTVALFALERAYLHDGFMARFLDNSGANSVHILGESGSRGGCRVKNFGYTQQSGAEYSTFRSYQIELEADYDNPFVQIEEFQETISWKGTCGPRTIWKKNLNGPAQKQITYPQTTQLIRQSGIIIGKQSHISPPGPLWPQFVQEEQSEMSDTSPKRYGPVGRPFYVGYMRTYAYNFESPYPLFGRPNLWI